MTAGVCIWFTGRSGAGKSTITRELVPMLEQAGRTVTVLDVVPELAKQPGERTSQGKLVRKAFVAAEVVRHGGVAICVTVSARREVREQAREIVGAESFVEILVEAPTAVTAERRAARGNRPPLAKRLRHRARSIKARVRGTGSAYEAPTDPDLVLDGVASTPNQSARRIVDMLCERGLLDSTSVS